MTEKTIDEEINELIAEDQRLTAIHAVNTLINEDPEDMEEQAFILFAKVYKYAFEKGIEVAQGLQKEGIELEFK